MRVNGLCMVYGFVVRCLFILYLGGGGWYGLCMLVSKVIFSNLSCDLVVVCFRFVYGFLEVFMLCLWFGVFVGVHGLFMVCLCFVNGLCMVGL